MWATISVHGYPVYISWLHLLRSLIGCYKISLIINLHYGPPYRVETGWFHTLNELSGETICNLYLSSTNQLYDVTISLTYKRMFWSIRTPQKRKAPPVDLLEFFNVMVADAEYTEYGLLVMQILHLPKNLWYFYVFVKVIVISYVTLQ